MNKCKYRVLGWSRAYSISLVCAMQLIVSAPSYAQTMRSSPAVANNTVYIGANDGYLYAYDITSFTSKWTYQTGGAISSSPAIAADGTVYFGSTDGNIYALTSGGSLKWSYLTGGQIVSSPAIGDDGSIYIASCDGYLYAINPNGGYKWSFCVEPYDRVLASPVIGRDGSVLVIGESGKLFAIDPSNGQMRWGKDYQGLDFQGAGASPAIGPDGSIYIQSYAGGFLSLVALTQNGDYKWAYYLGQTRFNGNVLSQPAIAIDGTLFFTGLEKDVYNNTYSYLYSVTSNGVQRWKKPLSVGRGTPCIDASGNIYVGTYSGVYTFDWFGNELGHWTTAVDVRDSSPVIANGYLHVGAYSSGLWHSSASANLSSRAWPMFQGNPRHTGNYSDAYFINVTVNANIPGLVFYVDYVAYSSQQTFKWGWGGHNLGAYNQIQSMGGTQYIFKAWSDGSVSTSHDVAPTSDISYIVNFAPAATIAGQSGVAGRGMVFGGGTYAVGASAQLRASGNMGWKFVNWSDGNTNNPRIITVAAGGATYTANFTNATMSLLLQAGNGGMAGLWTLGTNYLPTAWSPVTGPLGGGWVLRAIDQNRILLQQGDGGRMDLWDLDANGSPVRTSTISAALPGWIARDLDGNRVLLQASDGGMVGLWTLGSNNTPIAWATVNGAVPGLITRALCGPRILLQFGTGTTMGYWTLNSSNTITAWTPITSGLPAGWIPRSLTDNYILLQQGDGGTTAMWDLDANGQPIALHTINGPLAGWIMRSMDQTLLTTITVGSSTNIGGTVTGGGAYPSGASVVLTATASNGWMFTSWNDGVTNKSRTVVVAAGANYIANFAPGVAVNLQANPASGGTMTGAGTYGAGTLVALGVQPNLGWKFASWSDGNTNQTRQITLGATSTNLTANFVSAPLSVLLQVGDGGMAGLWGLGTNYLPATWSPITGALGSNWILRAVNQNRVLLQQGVGGKIELWDLTNGVPATKWPVSGALPGWIARDLDGNRILLQAGDGGMVGLWTLSISNTPAIWNVLNGAVPGLVVRALSGTRILVQFGGGTLMGYWTLNGSSVITTWTQIDSGLPAGWILRSMTDDYILLQAGDGGMTGMWDLDATGKPVAWHVISGPMPGWIMRGIDQQ